MSVKRTHKNAGPTYNTWSSMIQRCDNVFNPRWEDYGGRGITVDARWYKFENFLEDMGQRPPHLELDRIDNNKGYTKENCRWTDSTTNNRNKRVYKTNKSGHVGVFRTASGTWYAKIKNQSLGYFQTYAEAVTARERAERALNWPNPR